MHIVTHSMSVCLFVCWSVCLLSKTDMVSAIETKQQTSLAQKCQRLLASIKNAIFNSKFYIKMLNKTLMLTLVFNKLLKTKDLEFKQVRPNTNLNTIFSNQNFAY
jgi:hypothetical protein